MAENEKETMSGIIRVVKNKDNPYVMMNKLFLSDSRMSFKAKGVLAYLLSKPDNWKVIVKDLINQSTEGEKAVYSALRELKKCGYLKKYPVWTDGRIEKWESIVYETPESIDNSLFAQNLQVDNLQVEKLQVDNLQVENRVHNNNDLNNKMNTTDERDLMRNEYTKSDSFEISDNEYVHKLKELAKKAQQKEIDRERLSALPQNADMGEQIPPVVSDIFAHWNTKDIISHKSLTKEIQKEIEKALKKYSPSDIKRYIDRYEKVLHDTSFFFSYKWTLIEFLKRSNGIPDFTDEGSKWTSYMANSQKEPQKTEYQKNLEALMKL